MIHGTTKIELTYESVHEAIEEWLQQHLAIDVTIKLSKWSANNPQYGSGSPTVSVEFAQVQSDEETETKS